MSESGKRLNELRVCDLKEELEKRSLDTLGAKATLTERLENALKKEGKDPLKHVFLPGSKVTIKKSIQSPVKSEDEFSQTKIKDEPLDDVNGGTCEGEQYEDGDHRVDQVGDVDDECVIIEDDDEETREDEPDDEEEGYGNGETQIDGEELEDGEGREGLHDEEEQENDENNAEINNLDQEESINLTIGEDEQKLLHDEASAYDKDKTADSKASQKERGTLNKEKKIERSTKAVSSVNKKEEKNSAKEQEGALTKIQTKKDDKTSDKKDESSEQKSSQSTKTSLKDDKEKMSASAAAASNSATANANINANSAKPVPANKTTGPSRNLWVSGLSGITRASDLKTIFSKYGKVIGAKVVTNTRTPGTRCYGYVTMSSSSDASRCIENLHRTELHGRIISVERTKNEIGSSAARSANTAEPKKKEDEKKSQSQSHSSRDHHRVSHHDRRRSDTGKRDDAAKRDDKDKLKQEDKEKVDSSKDIKSRTETSRRRTSRSTDRHRSVRHREREGSSYQKIRDDRERQRQREILSYQKIREERERQRLRERERELREEERRRREIRERQRQEEQRLAEERKKLALERERLEREKAELIRLERERQKLEREKIELERLELKRQQMKIIHTREEPVKQRVSKRSNEERYAETSERKRSTATEARFEAPPPPRFDASLVPSRSHTQSLITVPHSYEKKRDDYGSSVVTKHDFSSTSNKRMDYASSGSKRTAIEDYSTVPTKRNAGGAGEYIPSSSSKRGLEDYVPTSKRDDYTNSKSTRDDYKREVEIRHVPVSSGIGSSFHSSSMHKSNRYTGGDTERTGTSNYRRGGGGGNGMDDTRGTGSSKRYESSSGGGYSSSNSWVPSSSHMGGGGGGGGGGSSAGQSTLKSYVSNGISASIHASSSSWQKSVPVEGSNWRPVQSQDRYDRTYNERSTGYPSGGSGGGGIYATSSRTPQERYGSGRY